MNKKENTRFTNEPGKHDTYTGNNEHEILTKTIMENVDPPKRKEPNTKETKTK